MCLQSDKKLSNDSYREDGPTVCLELTGTIYELEVATAMQLSPRGVRVHLWCYASKLVEALHETQKPLGLGFCGRPDPSSASAVTENLWTEVKNFPPLTLTCTVFILCLQVYNMFSYSQEHPSTLTDSYSDYCTIHKSPGIIGSPQTTLPPGTMSPFMYNRYSYAVSQPDVYELLKVNLVSVKPEISELSLFVSQVSTG